MSSPPLAPLVIRFGAFGDTVLMIPVLKFLHARFGRPCDVVASGPWTNPLLQRVPAVAQRLHLTSRRAPYWFNHSQQQLVSALRQRPASPVYVFEADEKPLSLLRRAGISSDKVITLRDFPRQPGEHILTHCLRIARATPAAYENIFPIPADLNPDTRPSLTDVDRTDCETWLAQRGLASSPLVLIQAGNKKNMKGGNRRRATNVDYWPESNWSHVIAGVLESQPSARVILCGSPRERPLAADIVAQLTAHRERVFIATDELPIPRLLALQQRAHSLISVNTGPAHAAAAMGCPLVVMFTAHPHRAADLYAPVATTATVKIIQPASTAPSAGLTDISPDAVLAAWRTLSR